MVAVADVPIDGGPFNGKACVCPRRGTYHHRLINAAVKMLGAGTAAGLQQLSRGGPDMIVRDRRTTNEEIVLTCYTALDLRFRLPGYLMPACL